MRQRRARSVRCCAPLRRRRRPATRCRTIPRSIRRKSASSRSIRSGCPRVRQCQGSAARLSRRGAAVCGRASVAPQVGRFAALIHHRERQSDSARWRAATRAAARSQNAAHALVTHPDVVPHRYPITPYHADYLDHVDRVQTRSASARSRRRMPPLHVRARDAGSEDWCFTDVRFIRRTGTFASTRWRSTRCCARRCRLQCLASAALGQGGLVPGLSPAAARRVSDAADAQARRRTLSSG